MQEANKSVHKLAYQLTQQQTLCSINQLISQHYQYNKHCAIKLFTASATYDVCNNSHSETDWQEHCHFTQTIQQAVFDLLTGVI